MITATFKGGPLDGQTKELPVDVSPLEVFAPIPGLPDPGPMSNVGKQRYVLHLTDKKGVAHYYVPTERRPA